jgi:hypothetical protein
MGLTGGSSSRARPARRGSSALFALGHWPLPLAMRKRARLAALENRGRSLLGQPQLVQVAALGGRAQPAYLSGVAIGSGHAFGTLTVGRVAAQASGRLEAIGVPKSVADKAIEWGVMAVGGWVGGEVFDAAMQQPGWRLCGGLVGVGAARHIWQGWMRDARSGEGAHGP